MKQLDPQHVFKRKINTPYGKEFLQKDPKNAKIENFQVFFKIF